MADDKCTFKITLGSRTSYNSQISVEKIQNHKFCDA